MRGEFAGVGAMFVAVGVAIGIAVNWLGGILMIVAGLLFFLAAARR